MKTLFFDCFSGAAGDMILGALVDAGVPEEAVRAALERLDLPGWELTFEEVERGALRALRASVSTEETHAHRTINDIESIIRAGDLPAGVRERALETFELLARAEAKVHGVPRDEVHFHEVGAVDAIVDIVGAAAALEHIAPERVVTSAIPTGRGETSSEHGIIPVPGPAVIELLGGAILYGAGEGELVTPTGAAILAAASHSFGPLPQMRLQASGYGAGSRDLPTANVLRVLMGQSVGSGPAGTAAALIETNIDDMSPELVAHALQILLDEGASDAWLTPIVMKKGRPAWTLSVLAPPPMVESLLETLYRETTTFGARVTEVHKDELERAWQEVEVAGATVRLKVGTRGGRPVTMSPEHEDARRAAFGTGKPLKAVYEEAMRKAAPGGEEPETNP